MLLLRKFLRSLDLTVQRSKFIKMNLDLSWAPKEPSGHLSFTIHYHRTIIIFQSLFPFSTLSFCGPVTRLVFFLSQLNPSKTLLND